MSEYSIIWHKVFEYQYQHLKGDSLLKKQVDKQLQIIENNPDTAGSYLKHCPPDFAGRIKRIKIGGRKKYRMLFKIDRATNQVKIGFICPELRRDLDYKNLPLYIFELPENEIDVKKLKKFIIK